jgi:hypothetical protein
LSRVAIGFAGHSHGKPTTERKAVRRRAESKLNIQQRLPDPQLSPSDLLAGNIAPSGDAATGSFR